MRSTGRSGAKKTVNFYSTIPIVVFLQLEFFEDAVESMLRAHKKKNVFAYIGISCKKKRIMECLQFQLLFFLQLAMTCLQKEK